MRTTLESESMVIEPKQFYRKIESIFQELEQFRTTEVFARSFATRSYESLRDDLRIQAIHLYDLLQGLPDLLCTWGGYIQDCAEELEGHLVEDLPCLANLSGRFAAVLPIGEDRTVLLVLFIEPSSDPDDRAAFASILSSLHYALVQHLRRLELQDVLDQARAIQTSLLPSHPPQFTNFDVSAATVPAQKVGGDVYDFQLTHSGLSIAIADAAGHGLPAALQARDVITGLRMAHECSTSLSRITERLNRIIHRSGLVSRFVSVVLGDLSASGTFRYVNAGHPRPLLLQETGFRELADGGPILGPFPESTFEEGRIDMVSGDVLAFYTDGVTEHRCPNGCEFGFARFGEWLQYWRTGPAKAAIEDLFVRLQQFSEGLPLRDDATVIFIRHE